MKYLLYSILFLSAVATTHVRAAIIHDDSPLADGDLSSIANSPTLLGIGLGSNSVVGQVGNITGSPEDNRDVFSFTVGADQSVTSIVLLNYSNGGASDTTRFVLRRGTTGSDGEYVGQADVDESNIGDDMLLTIAPPSSALTPGAYSVLINEFQSVEASYHFAIMLNSTLSTVQATTPARVPVLLILVMLAFLGWRQVRARRVGCEGARSRTSVVLA